MGNLSVIRLFVVSILCLQNVLGQVPVDLGAMESWGFNDVSSDEVLLMNDKKMKIKNLVYSGEGPAAWFMVGKDDDEYTTEFTDLDGVIIPDESGGCDRLGQYRGETVELTLPGNMKFSDYDYLSIYCIRFSHNFGYIPIKKGVAIPPAPVSANGTQGDIADDLPGECDQEPETRGGGGQQGQDEEDEE